MNTHNEYYLTLSNIEILSNIVEKLSFLDKHRTQKYEKKYEKKKKKKG